MWASVVGVLWMMLWGCGAQPDYSLWEGQKGGARVSPPLSFRFAAMYSDHMVLQRAPHRAVLWGYASPGATVTATLPSATTHGVANGTGVWRIAFPPQPATTSASVNISVTSTRDSGHITLTNVLFGDVWVCSGQSNMAFTVPVGFNATAEIAAASLYPHIRVMTVGDHPYPTPLPDFFPTVNDTHDTLAQPWAVASPTSIGGGKGVMGNHHFSATCWFFGRGLYDQYRIPMGLIHTAYGGSAVEDWMSEEILQPPTGGTCPGPIVGSMGKPMQQYNGMLHPLHNITIKGVIWYQGESNNGQNELYTCRFGLMMEDWRRRWHEGTGGATDPDFPFGFVQIGPNVTTKPGATYATRMGQTAGYGYAPNPKWPHTFMATAMDLNNPPGTKCFWGCVHVFDKQDVGHRLTLGARHVVYGENITFSGPRVSSVKAVGSSATITYTSVGSGIVSRNPEGFDVMVDGVWSAARVVSSTKTSVTISCGGGPVTAVRYAYEDTPCQLLKCAVYNTEGLPATPGTWNVTTEL